MIAAAHSQPLALGTMAIMGCYGHVEKSDAIETINAFLDAGQTYIELSLAWVIRTRQVIPVVGATTKSQTVENLGGLSIDLSPDRIERLNRILPVGDAIRLAMKRLER